MSKYTKLGVALALGVGLIATPAALADCAAYDGLSGDAKKASYDSFFDVFTDIGEMRFNGTAEIEGAESCQSMKGVIGLLNEAGSITITGVQSRTAKKLTQACKSNAHFDTGRMMMPDMSPEGINRKANVTVFDPTLTDCEFADDRTVNSITLSYTKITSK